MALNFGVSKGYLVVVGRDWEVEVAVLAAGVVLAVEVVVMVALMGVMGGSGKRRVL